MYYFLLPHQFNIIATFGKKRFIFFFNVIESTSALTKLQLKEETQLQKGKYYLHLVSVEIES